MKIVLSRLYLSAELLLFSYIMSIGALLILTRFWLPIQLLPWNHFAVMLLLRFLQELEQGVKFLLYFVLPSGIFSLLRLRALVRHENT